MPKKKLIILSSVLLVLLFVMIFMYVSRDKAVAPTANNNPNVTQETQTNAEELQPSPTGTAQTGSPVSQNPTPNPPAPTPAPATPKISLTGKQQTGQVVQVSAIVQNLTAGTCQATFTGPQGTQPFARTSPIVNKGNFYGCTDMNIPVADFPKSGTWHMTIFAANLDNKSNIAEADITVTK